jgi:hypothetical protein
LELFADGARNDDLALGGDTSAHGKTILPQLSHYRRSSYLRVANVDGAAG